MTVRRRWPSLAMKGAAVVALSLFAAACPKPAEVAPRARAEAFYATRPAEERPKGGWQGLPGALPSLRAESCGSCHTEIYAEWKDSTHGQAWTDRQFQGEIEKSGNRWLCVNCHTPLMNQMDKWAVGLEGDDVEKPVYVDNKDYNPAFRDEGITCAACHVRDGAVEGPFGRPTPAHPTRKAERFTDETICLECHQAVRKYPGKTFTCTFNTGEEWKNGPYDDEGKVCQSCHMPEVTRPFALGAEPRKGRRHGWPGSQVYKEPGRGPPREWLPPGLAIEVKRPEGETGALRLVLENKNAGHMIPTGDPERFITVDTELLDAEGKAVFEAHERIGQKWEWWPKPKKLDDNRLAPRARRELSYKAVPGAVRYRVVATNHRIADEAHAYHHLGDYPKEHEIIRLEGALGDAPSAQ